MRIKPLYDRPHKQSGNYSTNPNRDMAYKTDDYADRITDNPADFKCRQLVFVSSDQGDRIVGRYAKIGSKIDRGCKTGAKDAKQHHSNAYRHGRLWKQTV